MIVKVPIDGKNLKPDIVNLLLERVDHIVVSAPNIPVWSDTFFDNKFLTKGSTGLKFENKRGIYQSGRIWASFYFIDYEFLVAAVAAKLPNGSYNYSFDHITYGFARRRWKRGKGVVYRSPSSLALATSHWKPWSNSKSTDMLRLKSTVSSIEIDTRVKGVEGKKLIFND